MVFNTNKLLHVVLHYASDVLVGAAIGIAGGHLLTSYQPKKPQYNQDSPKTAHRLRKIKKLTV